VVVVGFERVVEAADQVLRGPGDAGGAAVQAPAERLLAEEVDGAVEVVFGDGAEALAGPGVGEIAEEEGAPGGAFAQAGVGQLVGIAA